MLRDLPHNPPSSTLGAAVALLLMQWARQDMSNLEARLHEQVSGCMCGVVWCELYRYPRACLLAPLCLPL